MSFDADDTGLRARLTLSRGNIVSADDSKLMQTVTFRGLSNELLTAERFQTYGHTSVPKPPDDAAGAKAAEVVVGTIAGNRNHMVVLAIDDRRYRMKNLKPGEVATHDDQGQNTHIARDGVNHTAKQHVMSATEGSKPLGTFELQDQLKGLGAHVEQLAHTVHGLFDAASRMRMIAQGAIPGLAVLAPILNQDPSGLPVMAASIQAKAQAYLQQHVQEALDKFTSPTIGGVASVLSGGIEGLISAAEAEIASLISANPVVAQIDGLVDELASLNASGSPATIAAMAPVIQGLIDKATAGNPVLAQVANLRSTLADLTASAGPGLGFLAPQQRMVQGLTRSLKLSQ
jgi:hypothetical protein